jgi:hypothetical protein
VLPISGVLVQDPDLLVGSSPSAAYHYTQDQARTQVCLGTCRWSVGGCSLTSVHAILLQFSLWAVMAAPLIISSDILNLTAWDLETYSNAEVIAVDQDALGCVAAVVVSCSSLAST